MHSYGSISLHNEEQVIRPSQLMSQILLFLTTPITTIFSYLKNIKVEF